MAEFVVSKLAESIVSQAVERISDLLIHEAASLRSVRKDVVLLQDDLRTLKGFLKYADGKQEHNPRLRDLVIQVRDVASDAEDIIETFIMKLTSSYIKAFHNGRIHTQIHSVRMRIQGIFRSMQVCGINSGVGEGTSSVELQRSLRRSFPDDEDSDLISLEGSIEALTTQLSKKEDRLFIVSVVGMGSLGKITLAKKVYNSVKQHFDCCAWVFVYQQFVPRDALTEVLTQVGSSFEKIKSERRKYERQNLKQLRNE